MVGGPGVALNISLHIWTLGWEAEGRTQAAKCRISGKYTSFSLFFYVVFPQGSSQSQTSDMVAKGSQNQPQSHSQKPYGLS